MDAARQEARRVADKVVEKRVLKSNAVMNKLVSVDTVVKATPVYNRLVHRAVRMAVLSNG